MLFLILMCLFLSVFFFFWHKKINFFDVFLISFALNFFLLPLVSLLTKGASFSIWAGSAANSAILAECLLLFTLISFLINHYSVRPSMKWLMFERQCELLEKISNKAIYLGIFLMLVYQAYVFYRFSIFEYIDGVPASSYTFWVNQFHIPVIYEVANLPYYVLILHKFHGPLLFILTAVTIAQLLLNSKKTTAILVGALILELLLAFAMGRRYYIYLYVYTFLLILDLYYRKKICLSWKILISLAVCAPLLMCYSTLFQANREYIELPTIAKAMHLHFSFGFSSDENGLIHNIHDRGNVYSVLLKYHQEIGSGYQTNHQEIGSGYQINHHNVELSEAFFCGVPHVLYPNKVCVPSADELRKEVPVSAKEILDCTVSILLLNYVAYGGILAPFVTALMMVIFTLVFAYFMHLAREFMVFELSILGVALYFMFQIESDYIDYLVACRSMLIIVVLALCVALVAKVFKQKRVLRFLARA